MICPVIPDLYVPAIKPDSLKVQYRFISFISVPDGTDDKIPSSFIDRLKEIFQCFLKVFHVCYSAQVSVRICDADQVLAGLFPFPALRNLVLCLTFLAVFVIQSINLYGRPTYCKVIMAAGLFE